MNGKFKIFLMTIIAVALLASSAMAASMICISSQQLKGEETVGACLTRGEQFAVVDDYGIAHILTPEEVELTKSFNPRVFEQRAFGIAYRNLAPRIPPLPVSPEQ